MPMKPHKGESQNDFMERCVPEMIGDGKREKEQAVAACLNMYRKGARQEKRSNPRTTRRSRDFMDRCTESGEDAEECRVIWADDRSATPIKKSGAKIIHKIHAEPVVNREFVMSDATPDRMGDIIEQTGWVLDNFKNNPDRALQSQHQFADRHLVAISKSETASCAAHSTC